jgi:DNA-binding CsgD family transcriptional regulator
MLPVVHPALLAAAVVGRTAELAVLRRAVDDAAAGRGSVVLVTGESGIGKSRLLREVHTRCTERGTATLIGRAVDTSTACPFRPLAEALLAAQRSAPLADDPDIAPFAPALATLVPSLAAASSPPASLLHVAEGFLRVARCRGRDGRGAAVLLDDLQWADAETLAALEYLADNVDGEPVVVIAAARTDIPLFRTLADRRAAVLLQLARLSPDETVEMSRSCLGDAAVPAEVQRLVVDKTDGLPFFVEELLTDLQAGGALRRDSGRWIGSHPGRTGLPASFRDSVRRRVTALDPAAEAVLRDAALLGRRIDPPLLAAVNGTDVEGVEAALTAGHDLTLLRTDDLGVRFRHSLTREALLADLTPAQRAERSARALAALRAARPGLVGELAEVAAELAEAAGERGAAAELLLEVGRRALRQGALTSAESALRRALAISGGGAVDLDVTEILVETLGLAGRAEDAFPVGEVLLARLDEAAATADPAGGRRFGVHLALARAAVAATDWPLASAHVREARRRVVPTDPVRRARLDALDAIVALEEARSADAIHLAAGAVAAAERAGDPDLLCEALLVHGRCTRIRDLDAAMRAFDRARATASAAGLVHREARALTELGFLRAYSGDLATLQEARVLAGGCGAPETEAVAENALTAGAWTRGEPDVAVSHADAGLALARRYRLGGLVAALLINRCSALALRGDPAAVERALAEARPILVGAPMEVISIRAQVHATCALACDDVAGAAEHLAAAAEIARAGRHTAATPMLWMRALLGAVEGGDPGPLIAELSSSWNYETSPILAALHRAAEAVQLGREGDGPGATAMLGDALDALAVNTFLQAVVARLAAPAAAGAGWGDPTRWLTRAAEVFDERGLAAPAATCRNLLRGLAGHGHGEITDREREVLALVAQGLANRAIAERLFLSVRTVEKHVERLLAKTGSANRTQLVLYAVRDT